MFIKHDKKTTFSLFECLYEFLRSIRERDALPDIEGFGVNERALFDVVVLAWAENRPLTVRMAIGIERLGSAATLHKRLIHLRTIELIEAKIKDDDNRTKILHPTAKGLEYASRVGMALLRSTDR